MTLLISVEGLITVLVIEGLLRFKQAGNYLPSEAALGCKGRCFLQGRQCPPWSSLALGMVALALRPWGRDSHWGAVVGLREREGRPGEKERAGCVPAGVFVVLLFECAAVGNCISPVGLWV